MTTEHSPVLEFPAMLYGSTAAIRRKVRAEGHWWAREYLKTGAFPQPMHSGAELDLNRPRW